MKPKTFSPLAEMLPDRTLPELLFLETKWASLMSYGMTSKLLQEVLPIDEPVNTFMLGEREITGGQGATPCGGGRNSGYQPRSTFSHSPLEHPATDLRQQVHSALRGDPPEAPALLGFRQA